MRELDEIVLQPSFAKSTIQILGVNVTNIRQQTALDRIRQSIENRELSSGLNVFFANVHTIQLAKKNSHFRHVVNSADMILPDGSGLSIAGKVLGTPILENLNGTDFTPKLFEIAVKEGWTVYLLGARSHVVEGCRKRLLERYPDLKIVGHHDGHSFKHKEHLIIDDIKSKQPDILLIALGSPHQETWIAGHASQLNARVCLGVGGLFDFISGTKPRAPLWMRKMGIEWAYRFIQDPAAKWERIVVEIPAFLFRVIVEKLKQRQPKSIDMSEGLYL